MRVVDTDDAGVQPPTGCAGPGFVNAATADQAEGDWLSARAALTLSWRSASVIQSPGGLVHGFGFPDADLNVSAASSERAA